MSSFTIYILGVSTLTRNVHA